MEPLPKSKKPMLELVIWPDSRLKLVSAGFGQSQVTTRTVRDMAGAMIRAMYHYEGIGLAAPQVGIPGAIFVMDGQYHQTGKRRPKIFINPQILMWGDDAVEVSGQGEGCLSFPYQYRAPVARANEILVQWLDTNGQQHEEWFEGIESIIIQHEFDHLLGKCFYDRISRLRRDMAFRKARKIRRQYSKGYKKMIQQMKNAPRTREYALRYAKDFEERKRGNTNDNTGTS